MDRKSEIPSKPCFCFPTGLYGLNTLPVKLSDKSATPSRPSLNLTSQLIYADNHLKN
jgi:hypothetical protein